MCCFSGAAEVHSTRIFARLTGAGTQVLVYQMAYSAKAPVAMILPLPVKLPAAEGAITWKDLKPYPEFFSNLAAGFPAPQPSGFLRSKAAVASAEPALAVTEAGDYIASFVPSVDDFARLDPRFSISKEIWAKIPEYADYGFAVFQLKEASGTPHPIALEFQTRHADRIFFPTVHIHDGTVHAEEQFDHVLYLQSDVLDPKVSAYDGPDTKDDATGLVRSDRSAGQFVDTAKALGLVAGDLLIHKSTIVGTHANTDTTFSPSAIASAARSRGCGRCDYASAPSSPMGIGTAALVAFAWIVRRRNEQRGSS